MGLNSPECSLPYFW